MTKMYVKSAFVINAGAINQIMQDPATPESTRGALALLSIYATVLEGHLAEIKPSLITDAKVRALQLWGQPFQIGAIKGEGEDRYIEISDTPPPADQEQLELQPDEDDQIAPLLNDPIETQGATAENK